MRRSADDAKYESNDGFNVRIWGPAVWHFLRIISFNYPVNPSPDQKEQYMQFVLGLGNVLPCAACRFNFKKNLSDCNFGPHIMESRHTFSRFIYALEKQIHGMVTAKPNLPKTFSRQRKEYENFRAKCSKPTRYKEGGCVKASISSRLLMRVVPDSGVPGDKDRPCSLTIHKRCLA